MERGCHIDFGWRDPGTAQGHIDDALVPSRGPQLEGRDPLAGREWSELDVYAMCRTRGHEERTASGRNCKVTRLISDEVGGGDLQIRAAQVSDDQRSGRVSAEDDP